MERRIDVGVLGATGMVGQQFVGAAGRAPVVPPELARRERALRRASATRRRAVAPADAAARGRSRTSSSRTPRPATRPKLVFSALDASVAGEIEQAFAEAGHIVVSNSRNYRMDDDVPLLVPEVNARPPGAARGAAARRAAGAGRIVTNPNCSTVVLSHGAGAAAAVRPARRRSSRRCRRSRAPATRACRRWDILGNVIPYIGGEEEKIETETQKILGASAPAGSSPTRSWSARSTTRVPVHRRAHRVDCRVALDAEAVARTTIMRGARRRSAGRPQELRAAERAAAAASSTSTSRTARSRGSTWTATAA